jgi:large subunit ribosomal protein L25
MENTITLSAADRATQGKGPAREMRRNGQIPAVIYGKGREPQSLAILRKDFEKIQARLKGEVGATVFDISLGDKNVTALVREVQRHPTRLTVMHVDFYEIHAGEKITLEVPLRLIGVPDGVKNGGGTLDQTVREIEVEVLPRFIPDHLELDVSGLRVGDAFHVSDIVADNFTILTDLEATVCSVIPPRVEETVAGAEDELEGVGGVEPELIRKTKAEEDGEESGS